MKKPLFIFYLITNILLTSNGFAETKVQKEFPAHFKKMCLTPTVDPKYPGLEWQKLKWLIVENAKNGDHASQGALGLWYMCGKNGVPQDFEKGIYWLSKAAERGDLNAQYNLGVFYRDGTGVPADLNKSIGWFLIAAKRGDILAQRSLVGIYTIKKWRFETLTWLSVLSQRNDRAAKVLLARFTSTKKTHMDFAHKFARRCIKSKFQHCSYTYKPEVSASASRFIAASMVKHFLKKGDCIKYGGKRLGLDIEQAKNLLVLPKLFGIKSVRTNGESTFVVWWHQKPWYSRIHHGDYSKNLCQF